MLVVVAIEEAEESLAVAAAVFQHVAASATSAIVDARCAVFATLLLFVVTCLLDPTAWLLLHLFLGYVRLSMVVDEASGNMASDPKP